MSIFGNATDIRFNGVSATKAYLNGAVVWNPPTTPPPSFTNPTFTTGSAVTVIAQSPFVGGGNSYSFIS
jgi:hypothetical protein